MKLKLDKPVKPPRQVGRFSFFSLLKNIFVLLTSMITGVHSE